MRFLSQRAARSMLVGVAATATSTTSASAAAPPAAVTPLAFLPGTSLSACPAADDVARLTAHRGLRLALRAAHRAKRSEATSWDALFQALGEPIAVALLCQPQTGVERTPLGPFGGNLATGTQLRDVADAGLRALTVSVSTRRTFGLQVGDRLQLPASTNATLDLSVHTPGGLTTMRVGPFASPPTTVTIGGRADAPSVQVRREDGSEYVADVAVQRTPRGQRLRLETRGRRVRFDLQTAPGAVVFYGHPHRRAGRRYTRLLGVAPTLADEAGHLGTLSRPLPKNVDELNVIAYDLLRQEADQWRCALTRQAREVVRTSCRLRGAKRAGTEARAARSTFAASDVLAPSAAPRLTAAAGPSVQGVRLRRQVTGVTGRRTVVVPRIADDPPVGDVAVRDVTGDGLPELITDTSFDDAAMLVSSPTGWRRATLTGQRDPLTFVDDLDGDGIDGLWLTSGRSIAGQAAWSSGANAPTIDLSRTGPLGPRDMALPDAATDGLVEALTPFVAPDSTGDGRPELLVDDAVIPSSPLGLGRRTTFAGRWQGITAAEWNEVVRMLRTGDSSFQIDDSSDLDDLQQFTAPRTAPLRTWTTTRERSNTNVTTVHLQTDPIAAPWSSTGATFVAQGTAAIADADPVRGEALVLSWHEGCDRRRRCLTQVRRVDRAGRVLATGTFQDTLEESSPEAVYVGDGPDADDQPEVLVRTAAGEPARVWSSTVATTTLDVLPVLTIDGIAQAGSTLAAWHDAGRPRGAVAIERAPRGYAITLLELAR